MNRRAAHVWLAALGCLLGAYGGSAQAATPATAPAFRSCPPLRAEPPPTTRPMGTGPQYFADAQRGDDAADGSKNAPWRTIGRSLRQLRPGDTLYLREGVYYENVYVGLAGRADAPVTIRAFPGERAVIDGGLREFFERPQECWVPVEGGSAGEYRSARAYPNLRDVLGSFGDSMVGLQTYYHATDLRAGNELVDWQDWDRRDQCDIKPLYCGPGVWYDAERGYLHCRLAHTHLPAPIRNYEGETDPRNLPLVLAPFRSLPLHLDGARHVRFQDLVIRGAGYTAVQLDQCSNIEFDNLTVWCGTYGIRADGTSDFRLIRSALYGNLAPWTFRNDASKRDYPGRPHRNISRLNTHALLEIDSGRESSVYAFPQNDRWEIAHSTFSDAHDGLYLGGINVRFHHNVVQDLQDDGIYLSPMYVRHRLENADPQVHIYQNVFRRVLTSLSYGGPEPATRDVVFVYRNLFDLRGPILTGRPTARTAEPGIGTGKVIGDHGSPPWAAMNVYHNTFVASGARDAAMGTFGGTRAGNPRRVFNNVFLHVDRLPALMGPDPAGNAAGDGNLYWSIAGVPEKIAGGFFQKFRTSENFAKSKSLYTPGSESGSRVADPRFGRVAAEATGENDYRPQQGSPAIDAGVAVPAEWPDPLRGVDAGAPDVGALPLGAEPPTVGR